MLCVVIKGPSLVEVGHQLAAAMKLADLAELRLDLFSSRDISALQKIRKASPIPIIMTLRTQNQGGMYQGSKQEWLSEIQRLLVLQPEYLDVESETSCVAALNAPHTTILLSHHEQENISEDLNSLFGAKCRTPAPLYKLSVRAERMKDALRFLCFAKKHPHLIAMNMGPHGHVSRILGPILKSPITYASLEQGQETAPGQVPVLELLHKYHFRSLSPRSQIYGLIGNPVDQSFSDVTHNALCEALGLDAVYIKMQVKPDELEDVLSYAQELSFSGLSVTMPLKEAIVPYLDEVSPMASAIGAVNTVSFVHGKKIGTNTDGIGAIRALERGHPINGKNVFIIGSGGAGKAIAYEAQQRGAFVTLVGRNQHRLIEAAKQVKCVSLPLDHLEHDSCKYDVLINATPDYMPIAPEQIIPNTIVMDLHTRPRITPFFQEALRRNCSCVYGYQMFMEQAALQWTTWHPELRAEACYNILTGKAPLSL